MTFEELDILIKSIVYKDTFEFVLIKERQKKDFFCARLIVKDKSDISTDPINPVRWWNHAGCGWSVDELRVVTEQEVMDAIFSAVCRVEENVNRSRFTWK